MGNTKWGSDTTVSLPSAARREQPVLVDFGGIGFTAYGVAHAMTEAQREEWYTPPFMPEGDLEQD